MISLKILNNQKFWGGPAERGAYEGLFSRQKSSSLIKSFDQTPLRGEPMRGFSQGGKAYRSSKVLFKLFQKFGPRQGRRRQENEKSY